MDYNFKKMSSTELKVIIDNVDISDSDGETLYLEAVEELRRRNV